MPSPLSFNSTENFRKKLLVKNLEPYKSNGFNSTTAPGTDEFNLKDFSVLDSPDVVQVGDQQEKILYTKNKYGPADGQNGFGEPIDVTTYQTNSNEGPYTGIETGLELISEPSQKNAYINNVYGPQDGYTNIYNVEDVQKRPFSIRITPSGVLSFQVSQGKDTYFKFIASTYPVSSLLLQNNPQGTNGTLSQDSDMIKIAATSLRAELQYRIAQETYQQTLGRVNLVAALNDPFEAAAILAGKKPLITADWNISVPGSLPAKGLDMAGRLTGVYFPYSWIPGDYFDPVGKKSFINQTINAAGALFGKPDLLPERKYGSDIFLANSGQGQVSALFSSLEYNDYRPDYKANFIGDLNLGAPNGHYYIGKRTQDPNDIIFPNNELPTNAKGQRVQTAVRGYGELATLYELYDFNFGLNTSEPSDDGGLQGGFTWISPKSRGAAGKKAGKGGELYETDSNWPQISSQFNKSESTRYLLTPGSILYDTQKLVDAADGLNGNARLQHVGNAINQTSKVFFDGTREITKGSRVKRYVNQNGAEVGMEYCRVFTKDTPFFTYSDLQKTQGNIRKSTYSVLDNTYNLNIAPMKGNDSTNIIDGQVKKYMFSLENLAWRTSDLQQDLPGCEKGPLGGRIMWFPPYDLRVDESVSIRWNQNDFLGRPEPIYTYNNTQRQGSISFKIVVDHPSILNTIIDKELANVTPESEITKIVDSFFAGCKTYDIYELAKKYGTLSFNEIFSVVEQTTNLDQFKKGTEEINKEVPQKKGEGTTPSLDEYNGLQLFFDNDTPDPKSYSVASSVDYTTTYQAYIGEKSFYEQQANEDQKQPTQTFFNNEIIPNYEKFETFLNKIVEIGGQGYPIIFDIEGSASSPNSPEYNINLSKRRIDSVLQTIQDWGGMEPLLNNGIVKVNTIAVGESAVSSANDVDCSQQLDGQDKIYSVIAMGCRRTIISNIQVLDKQSTENTILDEVIPQPTTGGDDESTSPKKNITNQEISLKQGLAKKMLRKLLSECDYFEMIKENTPFIYESMKEKIQFFNPTFHSITPEGLNSRLTFLQQCLRPGNTIPTIGPDGKALENDALNTSFGAPPICVLRVGDFWHTKIAINQMSIRYEPLTLDLNPEGIGVQPMLADVSLSFYFIGGHGLKEPVAQLQNALSFNYYANTEMYDERATATEDTSQIDRFVIENLINEVPLTNQELGIDIQNEAGNTIGTIQNKILSDNGTTVTGTTSFMQIMDELIDVSKAYADATVASLTSVNDAYLTGGLRLFTKDRQYITGDFGQYASSSSDNVQTSIFGKSENLQSKIDKIFNDALSDVDNDDSPLVVPFTIGAKKNDVKNADVRTFKKQVKDLINSRKVNFSSSMLSNLNDLVGVEQNFIRVVDKINLVQSGIDGFKKPSGHPILYSLTATTEVSDTSGGAADTQVELVNDYKVVANNLNTLYSKLESYKLMTDGWSNNMSDVVFYNGSISSDAQKRWSIIFGRETINNSAGITDEVLKDLAKIPVWLETVNSSQAIIVKECETENDLSLKQFLMFRDEYFKSVFNEYKPYVKGKQRDFTFSDIKTPNSADLDNFNQLYSGVNGGNKKSWNNKVKLD